MSLEKNISYLRRQKKITQEQLAESMGVARQTVSRWETGEAVPELDRLVELCGIFGCKLDTLVREDVTVQNAIYSPVEIRNVAAFRMARYVMITPNPENDVNGYMERWAAGSGLKAACPEAKLIGWDFPFVSQEQQNRFGLRGYVAAYVLPERFQTEYPGVEYAENEAAQYAVITITEPFVQAFERIPNGYKRIMEYIQANGIRERQQPNVVECFEHVYESGGVTYMDVYVHAETGKPCGESFRLA